MKILLLDRADSNPAVRLALEAEGNVVVSCRRAGGDEDFPCVGIDGDCPLDGTVDVAVAVHEHPSRDIAPSQAGVVCAVRDGIPIVLAGTGTEHPFGAALTTVATRAEDVSGACRRAIDVRARRIGEEIGATVVTSEGQMEVSLPAGSSEAQMLRVIGRLTARRPRAAQTVTVSR